jgi:Ras family protein T1
LHLETELRRASVICLVYSIAQPSSFDRLPTYWLPLIRSLGINVPVILVGNQIDLRSGPSPHSALEAELAPVMSEFKEVETCVECSAKLPLNVSEVFYFAQKAVLYPTAPLYDSRAHALKPACVAALRRIFRLCDADKDGLLSDAELNDFQRKCFDAPLQSSELEGIKDLVRSAPVAGAPFPYDDLSATGSVSDAGTETPRQRSHPHLRDGSLTLSGFLYLHTLFIQRGRLETTWTVLRTFGYGSDLTLDASFVSPAFPVPADCSVELSPHGYQFLTDVFEAHDKDHDGALSPRELAALFSTVPETPRAPAGAHPWGPDFPHATTVTDEAGRVTLQGWLAQWSMTTLLEPQTTLAMLAYLGYPSFTPSNSSSTPASSSSASSSTPHVPRAPSTTSALQLTRPRRERAKKGRGAAQNRSVLLAYVVGAAGSGKSAILQHMVGEEWEERYKPTPGPRAVVAAVEQGGAEKYLVVSWVFCPSALRSRSTPR